MAKVTFRMGSSAEYEALAVKDQYTFYYLQDNGRMYLGLREITSAEALADVIADVAQNASDIEDIKAVLEGAEDVPGTVRNLIKSAFDQLDAKKVDKSVLGSSGTSKIQNTEEGSGARFEHTDGTISYVGTSDGGQNGVAGQLYITKQNVGTRLHMTRNGFYYVAGSDSSAYTADDELAVKSDVAPKQNKTLDTPLVISGETVTTVEGALSALNTAGSGDAASKTVYLVDASGQDPSVARKYNLYQGSDPLDMSHNTLVGTVNVPLDQVLRDAYIVTLIYSLGRLLDDGIDVTRLVKGDEPATLADAGKYMKFIMQNVADPIYVAMSEFIDMVTCDHQTSEITLNIDASNNLTGTIGTVAATKIIFEVAGGAATTVQSEIEDIKSNMTWQSFS